MHPVGDKAQPELTPQGKSALDDIVVSGELRGTAVCQDG